jgi:hypothetical protein
MALVRVGSLPEEPLAAAAKFHADVLPRVVEMLQQAADVVLVFDPADHTHRDWRLGVVRGLARQHAPVRVNAIAGEDEAGIAAAAEYLARAPGVTGQLLPIDGTGAAPVVYKGG